MYDQTVIDRREANFKEKRISCHTQATPVLIAKWERFSAWGIFVFGGRLNTFLDLKKAFQYMIEIQKYVIIHELKHFS